MQPLETLPQAGTTQDPLNQRLQVNLTEDAARRIKVEAAKRDSSAGRIISELAIQHLPPVETAA